MMGVLQNDGGTNFFKCRQIIFVAVDLKVEGWTRFFEQTSGEYANYDPTMIQLWSFVTDLLNDTPFNERALLYVPLLRVLT